jgi:hypothetical protein
VRDGTTDEQWPSWLFERRETGVWRGPGPPPGDPGRMVPMDIIWKFSARMGQREKELPSGRYFGARDAASRPSDARVRHMRQRLIAQVPSRGALADKSATWQLGGGQLIPR